MRFQFVDRIEKIQKFKYARGIKTISFEEGFLESPSGETGCIPRTLLIECAAQLTSWLVLYSTDFTKIPLIAKIDQAQIETSVPSGTAVTLEIALDSWNDEGALLNCRASVEDRTVATGSRCLCTFIAGEQLIDPEEMRIRFRELSKDAEID
jgi:3-hydroxymyristoyl/3-hydroxydecanoyl-(acyl carrier protein) dehydratase